MKERPQTPLDQENDTGREDLLLSGPYDGSEEEGDLWFLPPEFDEDAAEDGFAPLPRAPRETMLDLPAWQAAEAELARELAALSFDLGRLQERVAAMGQGAITRLAQSEAASLSWWTGDRISADRIALWLSWRIGAEGEDGGALIRTAWAARHLAAPASAAPDLGSRICQDLGLPREESQRLAADVAEVLPSPSELGPIATGCAAFHLWRALEERPDHLRELEAAVLGARLAASGRGIGRGPALGSARSEGLGAGARGRSGNGFDGLPFLPLAATGPSALTANGSEAQKLSRWISAAHDATLSALMGLERLRHWRLSAAEATRDLSGRTPALLLDALMQAPVVAVPQLERETGASGATIRRNLKLFAERGLVREVTGQGRFRVWAAKD